VNKRNKKVAVIVTEYWDISHADVLLTKMFEGFVLNGRPYRSTIDIVSMYIDQFPVNDMGKDMAAKHRVPLFGSIRETLLRGGDTFDVEGVIIVGELGDYPCNEIGQTLYPRRAFFEECLQVMLAYDRIVPVFTDKGFAIVREDIEWVYDQVKRHHIPFMSSSVVPYCPRHPVSIGIPNGAPIRKMFGFAYSGVERYTYHALEMMQSIAENRAYGETGIESVRAFRDTEAIERLLSDEWRTMYRALGGFANLRDVESLPYRLSEPVLCEVDYVDGLKAGVLFGEPEARLFASAFQVSAEESPVCVEFRLQNQKPNSHWGYLVLEIEKFIHTSRPPHPVERSLLTTGALDAFMRSLHNGGKEIKTPYLRVSY